MKINLKTRDKKGAKTKHGEQNAEKAVDYDQ